MSSVSSVASPLPLLSAETGTSFTISLRYSYAFAHMAVIVQACVALTQRPCEHTAILLVLLNKNKHEKYNFFSHKRAFVVRNRG